VNRVWGQMLGRGVVHPVDDIRETSVASVPDLLPALSAWFVAHNYDMKQLLRLIATSRTYQLSAAVHAGNQTDSAYFSHFMPKQMFAQVLLDAVNQACGSSDQFGTFPRGTSAVSLPLPLRNEFLDKFGRSSREFLNELDPHAEPTLPQTLHLINSSYINDKLKAAGGTVETYAARYTDDRQLIRALYLRTLCRPPTDGELGQVMAFFTQAGNRREAAEDLLWALITSREFLFVS
jgi:hypothetical protein